MNAHRLTTCMLRAAMLGALVFGTSAQSQDTPAPATSETGGFLTDYSKLKPATDNPFDESYISPTALEQASKYKAVIIEQPEIFIHPDSKYKGVKPDDLKLIADGLREAVARELYGSYQIVDQPGPGVLDVRLAVGDLMLQKRKRNVLTYTPAGALIYATKNAFTSEMTKKIDLKNMKIEGEVLDSQTQEQLGAMTTSRGSLSTNKDTAASWKDLETVFSVVGKRLRCRLDNARVQTDQQQPCGAIGLAETKDAALTSESTKR